MRHVPIAQLKDKLSEIVAAVEAGEEIVITRHGRDVARLTGVVEDVATRQRAAFEGLIELREQMRARGVRVTQDELTAWKNEGRR